MGVSPFPSQGFRYMAQHQYGVAQQHPRPRIAHHGAHLLAHFRLIAMDGAV